MIKSGDHVKVLFRNGMKDEGYVISWSDTKSAIEALNHKSVLIIQKTLEDIIAIQIIYDEVEKESPYEPNEDEYEIVENLPPEEGFEADLNLRHQKLAELHKQKANIEREEVKKKVFKAELNTPKEYYGLPRSLAVSSINNSSREKIK